MSGGYKIDGYRFDLEAFFPERLMRKLTDMRVSGEAWDVLAEEVRGRKRRQKLSLDGKLTILAADHPARRVVKSGDDAIAMGDRRQYLGRVLRVILDPEFDGIMGTTDIIEDLFLINHLYKNAEGRGFLDDKVIVGCMNRGGLAGATFEMDDTFTSFTADSLSRIRADGAKMMVRIDVNNPDSSKTLKACSDAITELNARKIPAFLEILPGEMQGNNFVLLRDVESLVKMVGIGSAMGDSSLGIWLKLPYCEGYEKVAAATTCPILMLGGASKGDPTGILKEFSEGMAIGGQVRGALVGRNVTYPGADDPHAVASAVQKVIHGGAGMEEAIEHLMAQRGKNMDALAKAAELETATA